MGRFFPPFLPIKADFKICKTRCFRFQIDQQSLRRVGFISADTGLSGGEFTTPPLVIAGNVLELNVDCGAAGWLLVELQDAEGRAIPGYALKDCQTVHANAIWHEVAWTGGDRIKPTGPIRLRVVSRATKLYTFRFV